MHRPRTGRVTAWRGRIALGAVTTLLITLGSPSLASAAPPPKPSEAQIAAAEAQRRADIASLGKLTGQIAAIDGEIDRQRIALDGAVKHYTETSYQLQLAVIATQARSNSRCGRMAAISASTLRNRSSAPYQPEMKSSP